MEDTNYARLKTRHETDIAEVRKTNQSKYCIWFQTQRVQTMRTASTRSNKDGQNLKTMPTPQKATSTTTVKNLEHYISRKSKQTMMFPTGKSTCTRRGSRWQHSSLLLAVCIIMIFCDQSHSFQSRSERRKMTTCQPGKAPVRGTSLRATKSRRKLTTGNKPEARILKTASNGKKSRIKGTRTGTRTSTSTHSPTTAAMDTGTDSPKSTGNATSRRRGRTREGTGGIRYEMLQHGLLTADEEQDLGRKIQRAIQVRDKIIKLSEERYHHRLQQQEKEMTYLNKMTADLLLGSGAQDFHDDAVFQDDDDGLEGLSVYAPQKNEMAEHDKSSLSASLRYYGTIEEGSDPASFYAQNVEATFLSLDSGMTDDAALTEDDIVEELGISGGRPGLSKVLLDGALARDTMISSNVKLVVSIAKKWCRQGPSNSGDPNDHRLRDLYAGSWTRPSLDEAIQEGILGLAEAADRFDPERQLKFGTYATYWITNSVRKCFQNAATGCLRVPPHYHVLRQKYQKFVKKCYQEKGESPSMETAAVELGLTEQRLHFILRSTESLISMDAPAPSGAIPSRGGTAGAIEAASGNLVLSKTFACTEPQPSEKVDMSLLRQCLENAMAAELSPHERDVLRLRHGLDDGVSRSAREVVELCGGTLSVSDIRSAELRAFRKLRSPYSVNAMHLLSFLDHVGVDSSTVKTNKK